MRCGITLLGNRVSPRCTAADGLTVVDLHRGSLTSCQDCPVEISSALDLLAEIKRYGIDTLVCGGITRDIRDVLMTAVADIVDNVACSRDQAIAALEQGVLRPGFGLSGPPARPSAPPDGRGRPDPDEADCLRCADRVCLRGMTCHLETPETAPASSGEVDRVLDAALDVAWEDQRRLCRLAELVYFCLGMGYRRIGVAFCVDLLEPAQILAGVLRRFFEVVPVCCKVGGRPHGDPAGNGWNRFRDAAACNPLGLAAVLNGRHTELNVIVGLCIGVDGVFTQASRAPVSTLFVKDRSLANNPIGALYSEYYLRESLASSGGRDRAGIPTGRTEAPDAGPREEATRRARERS
jgi:uncharacterized metal-binding protein